MRKIIVSDLVKEYGASDNKDVYKRQDVDGIDNVFTIVGGEEKADAVFSYLSTQPANATLIIDEAICKKIIKKLI